MSNPFCHVEIPAADLERAIAFYEAVFGTPLERATVDGHPMAFFPAAPGAAGATGALASGESDVPGRQGARVYLATDAIEATLARAVAAGGRVLYAIKAVDGLGRVAEFEDSEGNCIALFEAVDAP